MATRHQVQQRWDSLGGEIHQIGREICIQGIHQQVGIQNDLKGMPTTLADIATQQFE